MIFTYVEFSHETHQSAFSCLQTLSPQCQAGTERIPSRSHHQGAVGGKNAVYFFLEVLIMLIWFYAVKSPCG